MVFMENNLRPPNLKPIAHIQVLLNSIIENHTVSKARPGQRFQLTLHDKKMCFLLFKGGCDIKRTGDSMIVASAKAPSIIGISELIAEPAILHVQASNEIEYLYLPLDEVLAHIDEKNLWKQTSYLLMYVSSRFHEYVKSNASIPTYELICNLLRSLSDEDFETRATVPAVKYILERTSLSRSGVMKILSNLDKGGYIVIKRGILIKINELPREY